MKWHSEYKELYKDSLNAKDATSSALCLLGFFCFKYKEYYNQDFSLSYNESFFTSTEVTICRKILKNFSDKYSDSKKYVSWYFKSKIQEKKKRITSLSALNFVPLINEFNQWNQKVSRITRSTKIDSKVPAWVKNNCPIIYENFDMNDFGDLKSILSWIKNKEDKSNVQVFIDKFVSAGIINQDLDIIGWQDE